MGIMEFNAGRGAYRDELFVRDENKRTQDLLKKYYELEHVNRNVSPFNQHQYQPTNESVVHLDRYQRAFAERGNELKRRLLAKVLFNFRATRDNEISVRKGDIVIISRPIDHNWVEIEDSQSGLKGLVPRKYLDLEQEGLAKVKFDFYGKTAYEISIRKGENVKVIRRVDNNWFEGINSRGELGIFPSSYVDITKEPIISELSRKCERAVTPSSLGSTPVSCSVTRWSANRADTPLVSPPDRSIYTGTREDRKRTSAPYRVLFKYRPRHPDELELVPGDLINVSLKCDDGWYVGRSSITGNYGTFPGNYVQKL